MRTGFDPSSFGGIPRGADNHYGPDPSHGSSSPSGQPAFTREAFEQGRGAHGPPDWAGDAPGSMHGWDGHGFAAHGQSQSTGSLDWAGDWGSTNTSDGSETHSSTTSLSTDTSSSNGASDASGSADVQKLLAEINQMRAAEGKAPLTLDSNLSAVAQTHSDYMASTNNMTHDGPGDLGDVMKLGYSGAAQNVGGSQSAEDALQEMYDEKNDPSGEQGHYQNIEGDYSKVGIGISKDGWLTIDFGK